MKNNREDELCCKIYKEARGFKKDPLQQKIETMQQTRLKLW